MKTSITDLRSAALISFIGVLPFMLLELVNRRNFSEGFPFVLFGLLWLLPMLFVITLIPLVRDIQAGKKLIANPIKLLLTVTALLSLVVLWSGNVMDQLPCFIGVPNCD